MDLRINNVTKIFKNKTAVRNFNCSMSNGVYGLVGPNGAGKTTLMKMMSNLLKPTSGNITVDGQDIKVLGDKYCSILGYLPQYVGVYHDFTPIQFMRYFAALKGLPIGEAGNKTEYLLDLVGLRDDLSKKIGSFSGGMRKRLGIAVTLLNDPKIVILDEPTAGLDPKERVRFRNLISELSGECIVLLSTHIISDIEYIAKEIIMINKGELVKQAKPEELLGEVSNKVWNYKTIEFNIPKIEAQYRISNILRCDDGVALRIISDTKPFENAQAQKPMLEDVYLYFFGEGAVYERAN